MPPQTTPHRPAGVHRAPRSTWRCWWPPSWSSSASPEARGRPSEPTRRRPPPRAMRRRPRPSRAPRPRRPPRRRPRRPRARSSSVRPSRSSAAATVTASGCRNTAPAVAPWRARARRPSWPTTTAARRSGRSRRTTRIRVRILSGWTATPTLPLVVFGRLAPWTIDGVAGTFPADAVLRVIPTTTTTATVRTRPGGSASCPPPVRVLYSGPKPASLVIRGAAGTSRLQLWSKPSHYDQFRGILRIRTSSTVPTITVVNDLPLETYLRGVVPSEMSSTWPAAALTAQAIASRSYAARRLHPTTSYYDVPDDSTSQVYHGALGENASTNAIIAATPGSCCAAGRRSPTRSTTRPAAAGPRTTRTSTPRRPGPRSPASCRTCVARWIGTRREGIRRRVAVRHMGDADLHALAAQRLVRRRPAHERRLAHRHRPPEPRRVGAPDQRDVDRVGGDEDGVGRRLPERLQRPPTRCRPDAPQHALRDRADPLIRRYRGPVIEPRPRCSWAGADGPTPTR